MEKPVKYDTSGHTVIIKAVQDLLNQYPGLYEDERIKFEESSEDTGIIFTSNNGSVIYSETKYIDGTVVQKCQYPFYIVYRTSASEKESYKITIAEFLETMGKWLAGENITIDGKTYMLEKYPAMTDGRKINELMWDNVYAAEPTANGVQDWVLPVTARYTNTFKKRSM